MNLSLENNSYSGSSLIPIESRMLTQRRIFLNGELTMATPSDLFQELTYLSTEDPEAPIRLYINSPGGSIDAGLAVLNLIQACPAPVEMYCIGVAANMAAVIFASGRHGRCMLANAQLYLDKPEPNRLSTTPAAAAVRVLPGMGLPLPGMTASARKTIGFITPEGEQPVAPAAESPASTKSKLTPDEKRMVRQIRRALAEATGKSTSQIAQAIRNPRTFTAEQAIRFGLCDRVAGTEIFREVC